MLKSFCASLRSSTSSTALSSATSRRNRTSCKLQPHRLENFKFAPKVRDIVGLDTNPRDKAIVLSVD